MKKAIFAKPNIPELKNQGYRCIDMHCHSRYSDGWQKIEDIYRKCRKLGIGVAIADHNHCKGSVKMAKYKNFLTVPAIETTSSEGIHTLFYFYNTRDLEHFHKTFISKKYSENPFSDLKATIFEIIDKAKEYSSRISFAHPVAPASTGICRFMDKKEYRKLVKKVDFIEAINGCNIHRFNIKSIKWGNKVGKQFTGGSDAHTMGPVGIVVTATDGDNFLDSLIKKSLVVGKETNPLMTIARTSLKFRMWGRFSKFYLKKAVREICQRI